MCLVFASKADLLVWARRSGDTIATAFAPKHSNTSRLQFDSYQAEAAIIRRCVRSNKRGLSASCFVIDRLRGPYSSRQLSLRMERFKNEGWPCRTKRHDMGHVCLTRTQVERAGSFTDEGKAVTDPAATIVGPTGVYNALKAMAVGYCFRPGRQILASEIADNLHVSSDLVTGALIRLHSEAWLDPVSRRGFFPRPLNLSEMIDLYRYGFVLLRYAALQNIDTADVSNLERGIQRKPLERLIEADPSLEQIGRCCSYVEWSYGALVSLSRNEFMISAMAEIIDRTRYVRLIDLAAAHRFNEGLDFVDAILAAVGDRKAEGIAAALERELDRLVQSMPSLVRKGIARGHSLGVGWQGGMPDHESAAPTKTRQSARPLAGTSSA